MKRYIIIGLAGVILGAGACLTAQSLNAHKQSRSLARALPQGVTVPVVVTADGFLRLERVTKESAGSRLDESAGFAWDGHDWRLLAPGLADGPRVSLIRVDFEVATAVAPNGGGSAIAVRPRFMDGGVRLDLVNAPAGGPSGVGTVVRVNPRFMHGDTGSLKQGDRFYVAATSL